jgi:hypothetical protein
MADATLPAPTPRVTEATRLWLHQAADYVAQARALAAGRQDDFHDISLRVILDHVLRDLARVAPDVEGELDARAEAAVDGMMKIPLDRAEFSSV